MANFAKLIFVVAVKYCVKGLVHAYPFSFENATDFFLSVFKKIRVHTRTEKRRFRKVPLWRPSSKSHFFGDRFIVYVWTEGQSVKKKVPFSKMSGCV